MIGDIIGEYMNIYIPDEDIIPIKHELENVLSRTITNDELRKFIEHKVLCDLSNAMEIDDIIEVFGEIANENIKAKELA